MYESQPYASDDAHLDRLHRAIVAVERAIEQWNDLATESGRLQHGAQRSWSEMFRTWLGLEHDHHPDA